MKQPKNARIRMRRLILGYFLLILGVLGLFLPLLQGIVFLMIAIIVLKDHSIWAHWIFHLFRKRFPRYRKLSIQFEYKIDQFFAKIGLG